LIEELKDLRKEKWEKVLQESLTVAENIGLPTVLEEENKRIKKRKRRYSDDSNEGESDHKH